MLDGKEMTFTRNIFDEARVMATANFASISSSSINLHGNAQGYCIGDVNTWKQPGSISTSGTIWITQPPVTGIGTTPRPYVGGGTSVNPWGAPGIQTVPMFPSLPDPHIPQRMKYDVPTHNYEPHYDIHDEYVGCKNCPYDNVHKTDPAAHPFTVYEEA